MTNRKNNSIQRGNGGARRRNRWHLLGMLAGVLLLVLAGCPDTGGGDTGGGGGSIVTCESNSGDGTPPAQAVTADIYSGDGLLAMQINNPNNEEVTVAFYGKPSGATLAPNTTSFSIPANDSYGLAISGLPNNTALNVTTLCTADSSGATNATPTAITGVPTNAVACASSINYPCIRALSVPEIGSATIGITLDNSVAYEIAHSAIGSSGAAAPVIDLATDLAVARSGTSVGGELASCGATGINTSTLQHGDNVTFCPAGGALLLPNESGAHTLTVTNSGGGAGVALFTIKPAYYPRAPLGVQIGPPLTTWYLFYTTVVPKFTLNEISGALVSLTVTIFTDIFDLATSPDLERSADSGDVGGEQTLAGATVANSANKVTLLQMTAPNTAGHPMAAITFSTM